MATSGDFVEVTCAHPDLGTLVFEPISGQSGNYDLGGFTSSDDANNITAKGQRIDQMNRKPWMFEIPILNDMANGDQENIQALQNSTKPGEWTFAHVNGTVYSGTGKPVGEVKGDGNNGQLAIKVMGSGVLRQI